MSDERGMTAAPIQSPCGCPDAVTHCSELLQEISDMSKTGGWQYSIADDRLEWTPQTYQIYGLPVGAPITPTIGLRHYSPDALATIEGHFRRAVSHGQAYRLELPFIDSQGQKKWVRTTGKARWDEQTITHVYGAFEDITEYKNLLVAEQNANAYLEAVINNLKDAVISIDEHGTILAANHAVERIFHYPPAELIGKNVEVLMPEQFVPLHHHYMQRYLATGLAKIMGVGRELPALKRDGIPFPMELSLSEIKNHGRTLFVGIVRDLTEQKSANQEIFRLAYHDQLTGLPNRLSFDQDFEKLLARAHLAQGYIGCSLIDIDRFAQVNLTYNKQIGDQVLQVVASRIKHQLPNSFKLYKNAADSFFLLYVVPLKQNTDKEAQSFKTIVADIQRKVSQPIEIKNNVINTSVTIASLRKAADDLSEERMVRLLEFTRRKAKSLGVNSFVDLSDAEQSQFERQSLIERMLPKALLNQNFHLELQPQYLANGQLAASEALVRWHSNELGNISPAEFIPIAENSGDILQLGSWILDNVCRLLHKSRESGLMTKVAINISAKQIVQPDFCQQVLEITHKWQIPPQQLILEITETTLVSDLALVKQHMQQLSQHGFVFSIDDFGTGYSSLGYLNQLPLSELKIDRCFVQEIGTGKNTPIVDVIIDMAKALGVRTVAEGIETQAQLDYLAKRGCDYFQGYYLSRPLSVPKWQSHLVQGQTSTQAECS